MQGRHAKEHGFMLLDAVFGLTLIVLVITMLTVAANHHRRGALFFALERELVYEAEHVLSELQQGRAATPLHADSSVTVSPLAAAGDDDLSWIQVRVERANQSATLVGWAPLPMQTQGAMP